MTHKPYQPDTERRKQAERLAMMGNPLPDVVEAMPEIEVAVLGAFLAIMGLIATGLFFALTGAQ